MTRTFAFNNNTALLKWKKHELNDVNAVISSHWLGISLKVWKEQLLCGGLPDSEEKEPGGRMFSESQGGLEWWREEDSGLDRRSELERLPESVERSKGNKVHCHSNFSMWIKPHSNYWININNSKNLYMS